MRKSVFLLSLFVLPLYMLLQAQEKTAPFWGKQEVYLMNQTEKTFHLVASTSHELSVSGGNERSVFRLSGRYMYDDSNLKWGNNKNQRYNFRLSNTFHLTKNFDLESIIFYYRQDQVSPTQIGEALTAGTQQPGFPSSTMDGPIKKTKYAAVFRLLYFFYLFKHEVFLSKRGKIQIRPVVRQLPLSSVRQSLVPAISSFHN